jgi:hypothetical protein
MEGVLWLDFRRLTFGVAGVVANKRPFQTRSLSSTFGYGPGHYDSLIRFVIVEL